MTALGPISTIFDNNCDFVFDFNDLLTIKFYMIPLYTVLIPNKKIF